MTISHKLIALAASAAVLVTGATAAIATTLQTPPQVVAATPAVVPTEVRVWADSATHVVALNEPTVAQALAAAHITLAETDRVSPAAETVLSLGDVVTVNRVSVAQESKQVTLEFATTEVKDKTLAKGERKVKTKGVAGVRTDVTETVTVDGAVESTRTVSQTVTTAPVNQVVLVGTKVATPAPTTTTTRTDVTSRSAVRTAPKAPAAPSAPAEPADPAPAGGAINLARADMWDRIAKCESSGNWAINTGNGYYGGLQFNLATWRSVGGTDFAAYPHQASRAEQITVANRLYAQRGLQPWGCRHAA